MRADSLSGSSWADLLNGRTARGDGMSMRTGVSGRYDSSGRESIEGYHSNSYQSTYSSNDNNKINNDNHRNNNNHYYSTDDNVYHNNLIHEKNNRIIQQENGTNRGEAVRSSRSVMNEVETDDYYNQNMHVDRLPHKSSATDRLAERDNNFNRINNRDGRARIFNLDNNDNDNNNNYNNNDNDDDDDGTHNFHRNTQAANNLHQSESHSSGGKKNDSNNYHKQYKHDSNIDNEMRIKERNEREREIGIEMEKVRIKEIENENKSNGEEREEREKKHEEEIVSIKNKNRLEKEEIIRFNNDKIREMTEKINGLESALLLSKERLANELLSNERIQLSNESLAEALQVERDSKKSMMSRLEFNAEEVSE